MSTTSILAINLLINAFILFPIALKKPSSRVLINIHLMNLCVFESDIFSLGKTDISLSYVLATISLRIIFLIWSIITISKPFTTFSVLAIIAIEDVVLLISGYAILYHSLLVLNSNAFSTSKLSIMGYLYYSVTTFTTTGYGDITPSSDVAKACVSSEMLLGFFVSTVIMAILVSKFLENRTRRVNH